MQQNYPAILLGALAFWLSWAIPAHASGFSLFHSREEQSGDLSSFPKWTGMVDRMSRTHGARCGDGSCSPHSWEETMATLPHEPLGTGLLKHINDRFNKAEYILDIKNWGVTDYWATPLQFLIKNGDCEDYAIAKYMALKTLGWPVDDMRVVVLQDRNLNVLHSVLAVKDGGSTYILDNQIHSLVTDREIHHYQPIYSINEHAWWRHLPN